MEPPALSPTQAAALARAGALTAELIDMVAALRARPAPVRPPVDDEPAETLAAGDLRRAFAAAATAPRRRPRWTQDLLG